MPKTPTTESDSAIEPDEKGPFGIFYIKNGSRFRGTIYGTRAEALAYMNRNYGINTDKKLAMSDLIIRPLGWEEREAYRFENGSYLHPVWANEAFWGNRSRELVEHYAHRSVEDSNLIAFTENADKGARDIQTRMKAGRYLKKFFPDLPAKKIAFMAEWAQRGQRPPVDFGVLDLKFASTSKEIEDVYEHGPNSCMSGDEAVRVYGAGDLAVAYLEPRHRDPDSELSAITARALVWPERKAMGRVYPTPDNYSSDGFSSEGEAKSMQDQLFDRLKAEGYTSFYEDGAIFDGARLLAIPYPPGSDPVGNNWVMPYIDNNRFDGDGKDGFFRIEHNGRWSAGDTCGYTAGPYRQDGESKGTCDECAARVPDDDLTVVGIDTGPEGETLCCTQAFCPSCVQHSTFVCDGSGIRYATGSVGQQTTRGGATVSRRWANNHPSHPLMTAGAPPIPPPIPDAAYHGAVASYFNRPRDYRGRFMSTTPTLRPIARVNVFDPLAAHALQELINLTSPRIRADDIEF